MSLQALRRLVLGSHIFAAIEGAAYTLPAPGVVDSSIVPDADDAVWQELCTVEDWEFKNVEDEEKIVYAPTPGTLQPIDAVQIKQGIQFDMTGNNVSPVAMQAMFRTTGLDPTTTSFAPLSGPPPKAWLKVQQYDQNNNLYNVADLWVRIKLNGGFKGGDVIRPKFECLLLYSALNRFAV